MGLPLGSFGAPLSGLCGSGADEGDGSFLGDAPTSLIVALPGVILVICDDGDGGFVRIPAGREIVDVAPVEG
ncbi:hypothetical protein WSS15_21010 [Acetobacter pasteurianus]|nr:hypothetical protein WSS15_21010 [Acetobacter pasteurianus]